MARDQARDASRPKTEFLSRVSHELRTPLNAILGFGQLLQLDDLTQEQSESVDHLVRGGRHLLGLINEILDISRIETGSPALSVEVVDLLEVITETTDLIGPWPPSARSPSRSPTPRTAARSSRPTASGSGRCCSSSPRPARGRADRGPGDRPRPGPVPGADGGHGRHPHRRQCRGPGDHLHPGAGPDRPPGRQDDQPLPELPALAPDLVAGPEHTILYVEDNPSNLRLVERVLARRADPHTADLPVVMISADVTPGTASACSRPAPPTT